MFKKIVFTLIFLLSFVLGFWLNDTFNRYLNSSEPLSIIPKKKILEKYSIQNLSETTVKPSDIVLVEKVSDGTNFSSYIFSLEFDPTLTEKGEVKKVTGLINIPDSKEGNYPVILLLRGYVNQKSYKTGDGTKRVGEYFAENGYITVSPDFLGYGGSSIESSNIFESRFQTYTTAMVILESIKSDTKLLIDKEKIYIWGHSNGGQIAITLLEVTKATYPTVLWAPVTKPFPYSILYYTDESDDNGKFIRERLSVFEKDYDVENYSLTNYLDYINAPISLHQGTTDSAVPKSWSDTFNNRLLDAGKNISYEVHPGADHNMNPAWNEIISKSLAFFKQN